MISLIISHYLCILFGFTVVSGSLGTQGSEATFSGELAAVTGGPASGEGLQVTLSDDDELEVEEEVSGGDNENFSLHGRKPPFFLGLILFYSTSNAS